MTLEPPVFYNSRMPRYAVAPVALLGLLVAVLALTFL